MMLHGKVDESKIKKTISMFIGEIYQKPPLRSAVKKNPRVRKIYSIEILDILNRKILMKVKCQAGTYIRKLCHDIGEILGCGANMTELRRIAIGEFKEDDKKIATLHELIGAYKEWKDNKNDKYLKMYVRPIEELLFFLPRIYVKETSLFSITHGSFVASPAVLAVTSDLRENQFVTINTVYNETIAIGISMVNSENAIKAKKGIIAKVDRVLFSIK